MVIVAGHLLVEPAQRESYLAASAVAVEMARKAPGCLDFAVSADQLEPGRINIFERWESAEQLAAFRGDGPSDELTATILHACVVEYDVSASRTLVDN